MTTSSITYNGVALTKINSITASLEGQSQDCELWYLDGPASGANNIVAAFSDTGLYKRIAASSYTGKTSTGIDANNTAQNTSASTTSPACNVTVVASDCWLVGYAYGRDATPGAGTATTVRSATAEGHAIGDSNAVVGTGSQTLAFTQSSATWPGILSASFSAGGGGGFTAKSRRTIGYRVGSRSYY